jgi:ectoine hydroxylase-related dioxygenase (phytanoyl-CoA dioxygenase family)
MITKDNIDQYNEEGYTIVEDVFSNDELNPVLKEFDEIVDIFANEAFDAGKISNKHEDKNVFKRLAALEKDFPGSSVLIHHKGELKPELANLWGSDKLLDMVQNWIGKDISGHPVWNIRSKTPQTVRMTVPWHQDSAYLKEGAEKTIQPAAWIPFLDVNKNNGCMQVVSGGHDPSRVLEHKLEKKAGVKDSWYLYIEDKNIPNDKVITCEMKVGSVLFLHQLVPHRSLENFSDDVRWSVDLRFQNPKDEAGFHTGLVDPIIMRKSEDSNYRPDWNSWFKSYGEEHTKFRGSTHKDKFDSTVDGTWLERWDTDKKD